MPSFRTNGYSGKSDYNQPPQLQNGTMNMAPMEPPTRDQPDTRETRQSGMRQQTHHRKTKSFELKTNRMQQDGTQVRRLMYGEPMQNVPMEPIKRRPHRPMFGSDGLQAKSLISPDSPCRCGMQRSTLGNRGSEATTKIKVLKRPQGLNCDVNFMQTNMVNAGDEQQISRMEALLRKDMQHSGVRGMMMGGMHQHGMMMGGMQQSNMMGGGLGASVMNGMIGNRPMLPQMHWR